MFANRIPSLALSLAAVGLVVALPSAALAQASTSRPVVQQLPPREISDLKDALRVLQRNPRDVDALLNAGYASLAVSDLEAAIGFFGRAEEAAPGDPRVKQGQASVYLRSGRPVEALELFARAEAAGAPVREVLSDRGLAYDLVGDQVRAQAHYREALKQRPDDSEIIRRMAVSQAIAGNQLAFEDTLRPLIDQQDIPSFRARAFGMAILGEQDRAAAITRELIPRDLADKIIPFLTYMPRLTKAQQAAAANLGIFPVPKDIGRENPQIAQYVSQSTEAAAASSVLARTADNRLEPSGEPFGRTAAASPAATPSASAAAPKAIAATPAPKPLAEPAAEPVRGVMRVPVEDTVVVTMPGSRDLGAVPNPASGPPVSEAQLAAIGSPATGKDAPSASDVPSPGFDLANSAVSTESQRNVNMERVRPVATTVTPARVSEPAVNFDDAFADIGSASTDDLAVSGDAVNIAVIDVMREGQPQGATASSSGSDNPRRFWVQLGTGTDASLLKYDWRRIEREVPDLLTGLRGHTVPYNDMHRLLAGPVESESKRNALVSALTEKGLGVLPYTSPKGTEIQELE